MNSAPCPPARRETAQLKLAKQIIAQTCILYFKLCTLSPARREMAQLKLAEQIIAEKDHDLHAIGYRADVALMEKEALEEEIASLKQSISNASISDEGSPTKVSPDEKSLCVCVCKFVVKSVLRSNI